VIAKLKPAPESGDTLFHPGVGSKVAVGFAPSGFGRTPTAACQPAGATKAVIPPKGTPSSRHGNSMSRNRNKARTGFGRHARHAAPLRVTAFVEIHRIL
jgi:hypothetical protein